MVVKSVFRILKVLRNRSGKIEYTKWEEVLIFLSIAYIITYIFY